MFVTYRHGAKMSAAETTEFPDLDTLINAAENRSGESSGEGNNSDKGAFDPDEYAGFVQWYSEQSKNLQRHYEVHLEHQKQKLAEENEAGLLEALQQSLKNFESDHMSDFASISSLDNACSYQNPNLASDTNSRTDGVEKQSMLKELLLSPFSENYSREVDSPEHAASDLNKFGNSSPESLSPAAEKPKSVKKLKPFAELLKHMEASEITTKRVKTSGKSKQIGTRLVNTKRYMSKYATANSRKEATPRKADSKNLQKRVVLHPMKSSTQDHKTITLSLKPTSISKFANQNQAPTTSSGLARAIPCSASPQSTPIFSTSVTTLKTVTITNQKLAEKRAATPPTDQLPHKKPCAASRLTPPGQSSDHDYCTTQLCKFRERANDIECGKTEDNFTTPESPKSKPNSQKVLKWQDYLRQVRAGVRSAPNSPTTSPKVARGSARPSNNFMIVSLQGNQVTPKVFVNTMAGKGKINGKVPIPEALRKTAVKQSFGLQEFDKYMKVLKNNMNSTSENSEVGSNVKVTAVTDVQTSKPDSPVSDSFSAAHSLAVLAQQQQQSEILKKTDRVTPTKSPQIPKSQAVPKNDVKKKLVPVACSSSGQLLMVQVPVSSTSAQRSSSRKVKSPSTPVTTPQIIEEPAPTTVPNVKPRVTTPVSPPSQSAPTFKLMTSNKDGAESKSLILSGVTGKLKDILTIMAEQQAKCKGENVKPEAMSSEHQLNTLQKLISCLSSQQNLKLDLAGNKNSPKTGMESSIISSHHAESTTSHDTRTVCLTKQTESMAKSQAAMEDCANLRVSSEKGAADNALASSEPRNVQCQPVGECTKTSLRENDSQECADEVITEKEAAECAVAQTEDALPESTAEPAVKFELEEMPLQPTDGSSDIANGSVQDQGLVDAAAISTMKFSMTRSMAAAEMMASDVIDDGTQEVMVYEKPEVKTETTDGNNNLVTDNDPAVITLEEAMETLENDEILNQDHQSTTSLAAADGLFCKLPSYFLTGKLVSEAGKREENMEGLKKRGMKNVHCDPLISSKSNDVEFNKLPHYMSSGKYSRPSSPTQSSGKSGKAKQDVAENKDYAVKLNRVDDTRHLTPQGTPVNTSETYFSKLPSYYTYGRPHPPVKTFNDAVAYAKDDTVTSEMIVADRQEKHHRSSRRKHKTKKKKKKHKKSSKKEESSEKVLYSKLPSYYLSGRVLATHEKDRSVRISPQRSYTMRSPSPRSLSYSSRSSLSRSRSRSPLRRTRRYSSRSYSRSSSRSLSGSEGESRRSWRRERKSGRSRRGRSYDRRSYDSSDEDRDEYLWRREREAWRARKQHQDAHEKERQRAMEERRVVYVGGIDKRMTKQELRRKFLRFGNIEAVSLHFRDDGDDYGFLTFQYTSDAFRAIEEGVDLGPGEPRYDLCFGGRRQFCKAAYQDLDSKVADQDAKSNALDDFDALLQQAKRSLRR